MLKNSFLGRRDEPSARPSIDTPLYPPKSDSPPLQAVAVTTHHTPTARTESDGKSIAATQSAPANSALNQAAAANSVGTAALLGPRLTVGPNIKLKGAEINDCDTLVVEGHVEASMDSKALEILQGGSYDGTVSIDVAEIHGKFSGNLTARKKLIVHSTGHVTGIVRYGSLLVSEGGIVSGDVASLDTKVDAQAHLFAGYPSSRTGATGGVNAAATPTKPNGVLEHARP
jgi:cytoskeletal protein CcmA (bactofilin family)